MAQPWRQLAVAVLAAAAADRRGDVGKGTRHHKVHQRDAAAFPDQPVFRTWCEAAGVDPEVFGPALRDGRVDRRLRICTLYPVDDPLPEPVAGARHDGAWDTGAGDEPTAEDLATIERAQFAVAPGTVLQ